MLFVGKRKTYINKNIRKRFSVSALNRAMKIDDSKDGPGGGNPPPEHQIPSGRDSDFLFINGLVVRILSRIFISSLSPR